MTSPIVVVGTEAAVVQVGRGAAGPPGPQGPSGTGGSGGVIVPVALTGDDSDDGLGSAALALGAAAQAQAQAVAQAAGAAAGIYAPLASPALTGTPTAPTASPLTDDTQIATTAYVDSAVAAIPIAAAPTTNSPAPTLTLGLIDDPDDPTNYAGVRNSPSSATPGTYGSATQAPSITVDRFGCISSVVADTVTPAWSSVTSIPPVLTTDNIPLAAAYALSFGDDWDEPIPSAANPLGSQPGVTPGNYTNLNATIDAFGRVTAAADGSGGSGYDLATTTVATGSSINLTSATNVLKILTGVSFPFTVNLPAGSGVETPLFIVDANGNCSLTNYVQVALAGSDTIRGSTSDLTVIAMQNGSAVLTSNQGSPSDWTALTSTRGQIIFSVAGTYTLTIPPDVTWVDIEGVGPGGAGGSGAFGTSGTACSGGGSGAGGNYARQRYPAASLPPTLTIVIPTTPSGGTAVTSHSNGNPGSAAANAYVWDGTTYYYLMCLGGGPGGAGQDTASAAGAGAQEGTYGGGIWQGAAGAQSSNSGGTGTQPSALSLANGAYGAQGGGSGGGVNSSSSAAAGAQGGNIGTQIPPSGIGGATPGAGGAAGTVGASQNGGTAVALKGAPVRGAAGGGGGAGNASGTAGTGGQGGFPGGGGGGGGATLATSSGTGGTPGGACIAVAMG